MINPKELIIGDYVYIENLVDRKDFNYIVKNSIGKISAIHLLYSNINIKSQKEEIKYVNYSYLCSIDLTEKLIKKIGFKKSKYEDNVFELCLDKKYFIELHNDFYASNTINRHWGIHIDNEYHDSILSADIQYLHQLQNIIYFSCNIELRINDYE